MPFPAVCPDPAAMGRHDFLGDGQAQTGPALGPGPGLVCPVEAVKDLTQVLPWNPQALVADAEQDLVLVLGQADRDGPRQGST